MIVVYCILEIDLSMYIVIFGDFNREKLEDIEQKFSVRCVVFYLEYNLLVFVNNDIVLIELMCLVVRIFFVNIVCLLSEFEVVSIGIKCFVLGE